MVKKSRSPLEDSEKKIQTRPPLVRMMRLHEELSAGRFPNCRRLSELLEVSSKTVQRDIDFMRDQLGLPIEYDPARFGFAYTEEVREFPTIQVTEGELLALFVAQKALTQYRGTSFEQPLAAAFQKLTDGLREEVGVALKGWDSVFSFKSIGPSVTDVASFDFLSKAIRKNQEIRFHYRKLNSVASEPRCCHPYHLTCVDNQWYCFGLDQDRQAIRTFVLSRMGALELTGRSFEPNKDFSPEDTLEKSFGIFGGKQNYRVRVRFDLFAAQLVRERFWHKSQKLIENSDGTLDLCLQLAALPEIKRWILSWGEHATVLEPAELKESIRDSARRLLESDTITGDLEPQETE